MFPQFSERLRESRREIPSHVDVVTPDSVDHRRTSEESARLRVRTDAPADVHVEYGPTDSFSSSTRVTPVRVEAASDHPTSVRLTGLDAGRTYRYRVWALRGRGASWLFDPPTDVTTGVVDAT